MLVNNAGVVSGKSIPDLRADQFSKTLDVNVVAPFQLIQAVLPDMLSARRGHIVRCVLALSRDVRSNNTAGQHRVCVCASRLLPAVCVTLRPTHDSN